MSRRLVLLTAGHSNPHTAKTACSVLRYRREEVVGVLDPGLAGQPVREHLQVGDELRFLAELREAPEADTLLIGIAPPGGRIPAAWRPVLIEALERGWTIVSGLHDFLGDDRELAELARRHGGALVDVRKNNERDIARRINLRPDCFRVHTVGHDCSIGKMVVAIEATRGLQARGYDAKFVATGQTGIMIEGDGCPIDCVVADFVNGAAEKLVLAHQHHQILLIEGQGSLVHPSYSAVTLGLLHGCAPHALILCYEVGRDRVAGCEHIALPPLAEILRLNETLANVAGPCQVIGIGMNSRRVDAAAAAAERQRVRGELGLPVCDVFRDGPEELLDAIARHYETGAWRTTF